MDVWLLLFNQPAQTQSDSYSNLQDRLLITLRSHWFNPILVCPKLYSMWFCSKKLNLSSDLFKEVQNSALQFFTWLYRLCMNCLAGCFLLWSLWFPLNLLNRLPWALDGMTNGSVGLEVIYNSWDKFGKNYSQYCTSIFLYVNNLISPDISSCSLWKFYF